MTGFPEFKRIALDDRGVIHPLYNRYQPQTSELTFTNLYIWREHHAYRWAVLDEWLVAIGEDESGERFALPLIGPPSRDAVVHRVLDWLRSAQAGAPRVGRADQRLVDELGEDTGLRIEATRDHYDYVYPTEQLISLEGRKLHGKGNHTNQSSSRRRRELDEAAGCPVGDGGAAPSRRMPGGCRASLTSRSMPHLRRRACPCRRARPRRCLRGRQRPCHGQPPRPPSDAGAERHSDSSAAHGDSEPNGRGGTGNADRCPA